MKLGATLYPVIIDRPSISRLITLHTYTFPCTYFQGFHRVGLVVDVNVTDPFSVSQNGDIAALLLDRADQLARSSRNHQINVLIHRQQVADLFASRNLKKKTRKIIIRVNEKRGVAFKLMI